MEIQVRGRHASIPAALRTFTVRKLEHLGTYLSTINRIDVELYQDGQPKTGGGQVAKVTVSTAGPVFRSKASSDDLRSSVEICYERLERRLKDFKRQRSGRPLHSRSQSRSADREGGTSPD